VIAGEWAEVRVEGASVYQEANLESKVLAELKIGGRFLVSKEKYGEFRRIKVRDRLFGFILDQEVITLRELNSLLRLDAPRSQARTPHPKQAEAGLSLIDPPFSEAPPKKSAPALAQGRSLRPMSKETVRSEGNRPRDLEKPEVPYTLERFRGLKVSSLLFREETMGLRPTDLITLLGLNFAGPRVTSEFYTDFNLQFFLGAPGYYQRGTGESARGFMFLPSFLLQSVNPQGRDVLLFYGLGPFLKYSSWQVSLPRGSALKDEFDLTDISIGAVFNAGVGVRFDHFNIRLELQHYWERLHYSGLGLSVGLPF
jgi:hypothetical protein